MRVASESPRETNDSSHLTRSCKFCQRKTHSRPSQQKLDSIYNNNFYYFFLHFFLIFDWKNLLEILYKMRKKFKEQKVKVKQ